MAEQVSSLKTGIKFKNTPIGKIPVDWEAVRLEDVCNVVGGSTPSTSKKEFWGGDIPFATPTDITNLPGREISDTKQKITSEGLSSCGTHLLPAGSILLTSRATIGACAINTKPMATNQGFASLVCSEKAYNWFVFYKIISMQDELQRLGSGSTFKEVSKNNIGSLLLSLPPFPEQKKIAEIVTTLDEGIEKTSQVIEKIKETKKGLMQKLLTRGIGHKEFKKTEIGEIPVEWEVVKLGALTATITKGTTPTTYGFNFIEAGINFIKVESIDENGNFIWENIPHITEEANKALNRSILREADILFSIAGALGRIAIVNKDLLPANTNQALAIIRLRKISETMIGYIKYYLSGPIIQGYIKKIAVQSAQANLSLTQINNFLLGLPTVHEQKQIVEILSSVDEEIEKETKNKEQLESLKKGLMQVLLTGKVRVSV